MCVRACVVFLVLVVSCANQVLEVVLFFRVLGADSGRKAGSLCLGSRTPT